MNNKVRDLLSSVKDATALLRWWNDPDLALKTSDEPPQTTPLILEAVEKTIVRWSEDPQPRHLRFGLRLRDTQELIGFGAVAHVDSYNRSCWLSLVIGDIVNRGQGYGGECVEALLSFCFETLQLNRVGAEVYTNNTPSLALFEKYGFQRDHKRQFRQFCLFPLLHPSSLYRSI